MPIARIRADHDIAHGCERRVDRHATRNLSEPRQTVVRLQLHDRAQTIRRVQPSSVEQRRIAERDRRDVHFRDLHGAVFRVWAEPGVSAGVTPGIRRKGAKRYFPRSVARLANSPARTLPPSLPRATNV